MAAQTCSFSVLSTPTRNTKNIKKMDTHNCMWTAVDIFFLLLLNNRVIHDCDSISRECVHTYLNARKTIMVSSSPIMDNTDPKMLKISIALLEHVFPSTLASIFCNKKRV